MAKKKIPASVLRDFSIPESDERVSQHGSQREDSIIRDFLSGTGWTREASQEAKSALIPGITAVKEGNGRGRGATFVDAFRVNPSRSCGGDFVSLKAPVARSKGAKYTTAVDLFAGKLTSLEAIVVAMWDHAQNRKALPLVVVHTDGEWDSPGLIEWGIRDLPPVFVNVPNPLGWATIMGIPRRPDGFCAGRGGNPSPIWCHFDEKKSSQGAWILTMSIRDLRFVAGEPADFAADVDRATVVSK